MSAGPRSAGRAGEGAPAPVEAGADVIRQAAKKTPPIGPSEIYDVEALNAEFAMILVGQRCMVLHEDPEAPSHEGVRLLSTQAFKDWMQNRTELEWAEGDPDAPPRRRPIANRWLRDPKRRQYRGMVFEPGDNAKAGPAYNLWQGFTVTPDPTGDASPFLEHLWSNVCREREELFDYLLAWFAHMVQRPRERIGTAVAIRGGQGTGKTLTGRIVGSLIDRNYLLVDDPRYLMGQFNAHLAQTLFLQADEAFWSGDKAGVGHLKGLITSDVQMIEHKGVDPVRVRNYLRLLVTSNEDWVVPAGPDERRWLVIDAGSGAKQDTTYFARLADHFFGPDGERHRGALLHHLMTLDISDTDLRKVPKTNALYEQKVRSLSSVEAFWLERLMEGGQLPGEPWLDKVPKPRLLGAYQASAERAGVRYRGSEIEFGIALKRLVEGIRDGKCFSTIASDPDDPGPPKRVNAYIFPTLEACRRAFAERLGQSIEWPVAEDEEAF